MKQQDIYVDSTALKMLGCIRKYYYAVVQGLVPKETSIPLLTGSAGHKYIEWEGKGDFEPAIAMMKAIEICPDKEKDLLQRALVMYDSFNKTSLAAPIKLADGSLGIEVKFKFLWQQVEGYDVYLCGTIDRIACAVGSVLNIIDFKFTRKWDQTGFLESYLLDVQPLFYLYCLRKYGSSILPQPYARMAFDNAMAAYICGVFLSNKPLPKLKLSPPIQRSPEDFIDFSNLLETYALTKMLRAWRSHGNTIEREGLLTDACGYCNFKDICLKGRGWDNFNTRLYDPSNFR